MHACIYVFITGPKTHTEELVASALAPFDMNLDVPPYKHHLANSGVRAMAEHYGLPETDLSALAGKLPDWMHCSGGVDELGLFAYRTDNPDGKWDWYEIGGRWDGHIIGNQGTRRPKQDLLTRNSLTAAALLAAPDIEERIPYGVLAPIGEWSERITLVAKGDGWSCREIEASVWREHVRCILAVFPTHRVVCVDIHF